MIRSALTAIGSIVVSVGLASAALGPRNSKGWVGMDTLAPAPSLPTSGPASYLNVLVGTTASGVVTNTPADDQSYNDGNLCSYGTMNPYGGSARCDTYVHTNGIVTRGNSTAYFDNKAFLDTRYKMVLAPFWDDLAPIPGVSTITWEVEAGQFFIYRWNNFALYSNPSANLSFQVVFNIDGNFDAPRWVLFQYGRMEGVGADGSSATIGIQYNNSGNNNARHGPAFNHYAHNVPGSIVTGDGMGLALQAILFDLDADFDRLPRNLETRLGISDTTADSDLGGVDDGAEYGNTDPVFGADDIATDTDGDGLSNLDENFYGSNPGVDDTDGDGLNDPDEVAAGSNPADGGSFPTALLSNAGNTKGLPQAAVDASGNVHAVAFDGQGNSSLFYYMFSRAGQPLIGETAFKGTSKMRRPQVHAHAGKVYVTYEIADTTTNTATIRLLRINPAADDQNGDAAMPATVTELDVVLALGVKPRHHDARVDASGVHLVWEDHPDESPSNSGDDGPVSIRYGRVSLGGALQAETTLMTISRGRGNRPPFGIHRRSLSPRLAVDTSGVAHVVWSAQSRPRSPQNDDYAQFPHGMFYAATDGSATSGPFAIGSGRLERLDIALHQNRYLYITSTAGGGDADAYYITKGVQLGILDTQAYAVIPRVGDDFDVEWSVVQDTMLLPHTTIVAPGGKTLGAGVHVLSNGAALLYYNPNRTPQFCVAAAAPDGTMIDQQRCFFQGQHYYRDRLPSFVQPMGAAFVGVVHSNRNNQLRYDPIALSNWDTSGVTLPNSPPIITTSAPAGLTPIGQPYSYAAAATDPETASGNLVWSLENPPTGMNVSGAGLVTFTPTVAQVGDHEPSLKVCDDDASPRCSTQPLPITVPQPNEPVIVSTPAQIAVANTQYQYQVIAFDADDDIASFDIVVPVSPPGDMALTPNAGGALLTWTPTNGDIGTLSLLLAVTDDSGLVGGQAFAITVTPNLPGGPDGGTGGDGGGGGSGDRPPAFTSIPATTALVDEAYSYQIGVVDPDDAAAEIALAATLDGEDVEISGGVLSWTPSERGTVTIAVVATSGGLSATQSFAVTVVGGGEIDSGCGCSVGQAPPAGAAGIFVAMLALAARRRRRG